MSNSRYLWIGASVLLFILAGFCPAIDVLGKTTCNGFWILFKASGMGISRFWMFLMLAVPLCCIVLNLLNLSPIPDLKEKMPLIHFGVSTVASLLFIFCLPVGATAAFGTILYLIVALASTVLAYLDTTK